MAVQVKNLKDESYSANKGDEISPEDCKKFIEDAMKHFVRSGYETLNWAQNM
ncbi:hypothetical protein [Domibacillus epiphyticus]|uniref:hypothetical protein n=1 Tax=Domibacillus epiphyticus TaxID=1714355 RepID=UPI00130178BA|nr:hypothetical protein [Domibacillus epiphyticus]